uniref:NADH-ubiquinone oxidoreductase chain 6 n=1 Tax=Lepidocyrtus fimetarius TaxID=2583952 RepID=A0A6G8FF31_9HEXA|nr:NADH dehydrogenase subunit 6 [Lepidocyrtus fimetarius]QIM14975.1 NADH dehydrogenase subunit 6 [Lepidocyrtus fimetarius]
MKLIMIMSTALTLIMFLTNHPVTITFLILIQSILMCILVWMLSYTSWFSFTLFLIFVGGLMVLFIYITSLASNEKFELNFNKMAYPILFIAGLTLMILATQTNSFKTNAYMNSMNSLKSMFSMTLMPTTMMIMVYLLLTLIIVVKISKKMEGPIRLMTNLTNS